MNKKTLIFSLLIVATFIASSFFAINIAKKMTTVDNNIPKNTPDFFMTNASYTKFNNEGKISSRIKTIKITHTELNDTYIFNNPKITIYNPNEKPWYISSKQGKSEQGKSKVYLWDTIKIIQNPGPNNPSFDIATEAITVYPDRKFAETDLPIRIIQQENIIDAVGAELNLKTSSIKLLSKIKGSYIIE